MIRKSLFAAALAAFITVVGGIDRSASQTAPNWYYGKVPTTAEWAQAWSSKQDYLGAAPVLVTGAVMQGRLVTVAPSTRSGFNLTPGATAPTSPFDGDLWVTSSGLFVRINGATVGPLAPAAGGGVCTNQVVTAITAGVPVCASITNAMLTAGTFSSITGVGTLTAGATGAGFTINLGASTVTGNLTAANLNGGTGASSSTAWFGDNTWKPAGGSVTSAQVSAGAGIAVSGTCTITTSGNCTVASNNSMAANKMQVFAASSGTITTPTGAAWAKFTLVGAGGSGSGGGTTGAADGNTGGNTCINTSGAACTSPVWQAGGGTGGLYSTGAGGAGGNCSGSGSFLIGITGADGSPTVKIGTASGVLAGAPGGDGPFGLGHGGARANAGAAGQSGSGFGSGGQGGANSVSVSTPLGGAGGGGGAGCIAFVQSPASSYTYATGAVATGGAAGTNGQAGGASAQGYIIAEFGFN